MEPSQLLKTLGQSSLVAKDELNQAIDLLARDFWWAELRIYSIFFVLILISATIGSLWLKKLDERIKKIELAGGIGKS